MTIGLLYESPETDENGIKLTAEQLGIDLTIIPFRKIAVTISKHGCNISSKGKNFTNEIKNISTILNRAQSKNRRLYAAHTMEALGKKVINPSSVEFTCYSKFRTLMRFWSLGLPIPKTVYVPCDPTETLKGGRILNNETDIADLLLQEIGQEVVVKPDAGTHGKAIVLSKNRNDLITNIQQTTPSIINPIGIVGQEFVDKWFYDLRIVVFKEPGKSITCHHTALARAGFNDFRTNTFLGNLVFDAALPQSIRELAIKCGKALGGEHEAWVFGLDAMINGGQKNTATETVKEELSKASVPFGEVKKAQKDPTRLRDFKSWNARLERAVSNYKNTEPYIKVKNIIEQNIESNQQNIVFHEANACPDFWENTRLITGINLAIPLLKSAQSLKQ
jgi:glutathione synthase/RimK-type ligase-like ATP-grasp enzyme